MAQRLVGVSARLATVEAERSGDVGRFFELDEQFHQDLLALAGHESAWRTVNTAKAQLDRARRLSLVDTRPMATLVAQHRAVVDAVDAGRLAQAIERLREHLRAVFDDVETIRAARPDLFAGEGNSRPVRRTVTRLG